MATNIEAFIQAIKNHEFIQAHELLEHDWKTYKKKQCRQEAKALQGLINGATALALFHIKKRPQAYERIWTVFEKYAPLLDEVDFEEMNKYHFAKELLIEKNRELVIKKQNG